MKGVITILLKQSLVILSCILIVSCGQSKTDVKEEPADTTATAVSDSLVKNLEQSAKDLQKQAEDVKQAVDELLEEQ